MKISIFVQIVGASVSGMALLILFLLSFFELEYSNDNQTLAFIYTLIPLFTPAAKVRLKEGTTNKIEVISLIGFFLGLIIAATLIILTVIFDFVWEPAFLAVGGEFFGGSIAGFLLITTDM